MPDPDTEYDPERCTACRGTGKVISGRGGEPSVRDCPWCGGTGRFQRGRNAQDPDAPPPEDGPEAA